LKVLKILLNIIIGRTVITSNDQLLLLWTIQWPMTVLIIIIIIIINIETILLLLLLLLCVCKILVMTMTMKKKLLLLLLMVLLLLDNIIIIMNDNVMCEWPINGSNTIVMDLNWQYYYYY